ncbi:unnamed protein product, partial [Pylaiella littoralis]
MEGSDDRTALHGMEKRLFELVSNGATSAQWAEWLRVPLEHALAEGDKELAMSLLKAGADWGSDWEGCDGRTFLDAAAEGGNKEVVSALLDAGGLENLNAVSGDKKVTALHRAIVRGHTAVAWELMVAGANVNLLDARNRSALHYAVDGGHLQLTGNLMIAGADLHAKDTDGDTPLHLAVTQDDDKFVCTLLRRGAKVDEANNKGQHPLHAAVARKRVTVVKALLKAGADPNARHGGRNMCSPLFLARDNLAMTQTLLNHGADVKSSDDFSYTALHWAVFDAKAGVIDALVEAGANLETQSSSVWLYDQKYSFEGLKPLHVAAFWHNVEAVVVLLRKGADINAKDAKGLTPLHVTCKCSARAGSFELSDLLLRWGADETATDNDGKTP